MTTPGNVGRYQVSERVAAGSFATVWRARDPELDTDVAIKILADNWAGNADVRSRFVEEARMLRRAYSDRVVRVYDIGTIDDGRPYFVMSFADRGTLHDRLVDGRLATDMALQYTKQASQGIAALHELGILHRDIKPSNIVFISTGRSERLLIADLGLAKSMVHGTAMTVTGGTPGYMAPEQAIHGGKVDPRTDVYGLGAVAYHMLTGRPTTNRLTGGPITPPSQLSPDLAGPIEAVVLRALDHDPDNRWPDVTAFLRALDELPEPDHAAAGAMPAPTVLDPGSAASSAPPAHPTPTTADLPHQLTPTPAGAAHHPGPTTAEVPQQPMGMVGPHQSAPHPGLVPGLPARPKKRILGMKPPVFFTLISLVVVLTLLLPVAIWAAPRVWIRIPQTVASANGAISIKVPPIWTTDDNQIEPVEATVDSAGFGVTGDTALQLSTQDSYGEGTVDGYDDIRGFSVIAGENLGKLPPEKAVGYYRGGTWDGVEKSDACRPLPDREVTPPGFTKGVMRTYECPVNNLNVHAVVTKGDAAAHIFVYKPLGATEDQLEDMVRSLDIDVSKLP